MKDLVDQFFQPEPEQLKAKLDEYYPGSKRKRRALNPEVEARKAKKVDAEAWDANPQLKKSPNGRTLELFSAGAMSQALGRPLVTLRLWERRGYIPRAPYRLKSMMVKGVKKPGWRMYSREIIEATVKAFRERDLLDSLRIDWNKHHDLTIELVETWNAIHEQETN
jgi:hypothetical protein